MTPNLPTSFFVTGTDTEVGKTLLSGALILKLREAGIRAIGFKPVVAGTYLDLNGQKLNEDLETLRIASGLRPHQQTLCDLHRANGIHGAVRQLQYLASKFLPSELRPYR